MTPMLQRTDELEVEFDVSFRSTAAPSVPFEISTRHQYNTQTRYRKRRGCTRIHNSARLRRDKHGGL